MSTYTRRNFIKSSALCSALLSVPVFAHAAPAKGKPAKTASAGQIEIPKGAVILFQGDSITDDGRAKTGPIISNPNHPKSLGGGYAFIAAAAALNKFAERNVKIFNRGVSGNKVADLVNRWEKDTIALKPDILSILIGVNDFWRTMDRGEQGTAESYEKTFRALLQQTVEKLPKTRIVIGEPFAIETGKAVKKDWFPKFDGYRAAARKLAEEFNLTFIPYQSVFDEACKRARKEYWSEDGVHPTLAGKHLMSEAWLAAFK